MSQYRQIFKKKNMEINFNEAECGNCKFFEDGDCKRFPPTVVSEPYPDTTDPFHYIYPSVRKSDWCGEFKPIEFDEI